MHVLVKRWLALLVAVILTGCPAPGRPVDLAGAIPAIEGQADFTTGRQVQAAIIEVAEGATVSLIEPATNTTVATTVTDASGSFRLSFDPMFKPGLVPYYLEAVKGLKAGGTSNRAGASAARIRTLVSWTGASWKSVSAGTVTASFTTTALCIIASLRGGAVSLPALIDSLAMGTPDSSLSPTTPDTFTPGTSSVSNAEYHQVYQLAANALTLDQDPFQVVFRLPDGTYQRAGAATSVARLYPVRATIGATMSIIGQNFVSPAGDNRVIFAGGVEVGATDVSADRTQLTVTVPAGAGSGPVQVRSTTGDLRAEVGFLQITNAPLAGTRFVGFNGGTTSGDAGAFVRVIAQQANTQVTYQSVRTSGVIDYSSTQTLGAAGNAWQLNVNGDSLGMFRILSDKPVFVSYDNIAAQATDAEWASQTGTDYYFRVPGTHGGFQIISHAAANPVTVTCITDPAQSATQTLAEGAVYGRTSMPTLASSYLYRVQSTYPTTVTYGVYRDSGSTQIYSSDMQTYYEAHTHAVAAGAYQLVGYRAGTSVTVTNLGTGAAQTFTLAAGDRITQAFPAGTGLVRTKVVSNQPVGFYVGDSTLRFDAGQHGSADQPGTLGTSYRVVAPSRAATRVYVLSLKAGNSVALTGGLTGTMTLGELEWRDAGSLAANTALTVAASHSVAVFTSDNLWQQNYSLLPY